MLWLIWLFLLFQWLYHLFVTFFGYGLAILSPEKIAILRDVFWIILSAGILLFNRKLTLRFFRLWKKSLLAFLFLFFFVFLVSYFGFEKSIHSMLIWIKYGFWYLWILFSACGVGFILGEKKRFLEKKSWIKRMLVLLVSFGWIRQFGKLLFPEFFYNFWYGVLDNFHFGDNPPLYYLTWFEGSLRWQGLFSGPNNYGYFLAVFTPLLFYLFPLKSLKSLSSWKKSDFLNLLFVVLWMVSLVFTLSRTAILGVLLLLILQGGTWMKKHKYCFWIFVSVFLLWVGLLSVFKWKSTLQHFSAKWGGILQVIDAPLGYGLWSSGPAIHHQGFLLPENYYLQILLDVGTVGFLIRCGVLYFLFEKQKKLLLLWKTLEGKEKNAYYFLRSFQWGMFIFLVMGFFLHVFEDSMVNYLFFIWYGLSLGANSFLIEQKYGYEKNNKKLWSFSR